jgi:hypothetical protein
MAKSLVFDYTFSPSTDTITVDGNVALKRVLLITNVTRNIILYNFADGTRGISAWAYSPSTDSTTYTLEYDCAAMSADDQIQIFIEQDSVRFEPAEHLTDPVSKIRVSQPNTLIDTDFEYGLQSSKWETLERMNDIPAFHSLAGDVPLGNVVDVTVNGTNVVTITTSSPHGISTGTPIDVRGIDSSTAEGTFVVKRVTDYTFTYEARSTQNGTVALPVSINTSYSTITSGRFYVGSNIQLDNTATNTDGTLITNGTDTLTARTTHDHSFKVGSTVALVNSLSRSAVSFDPRSVVNGGQVEDRSSVSLATGNFTIFEPFHDGTIRRTIPSTNLNTTSSQITIPTHGMITGDPIAFVGFSSGGASPSIDVLSGNDFPLSSGNMPIWGTSASGIMFAVVIDQNTIRVASNPKDAYNGTNLIQISGRGSGNMDFALFKRGDRFEDKVSSFATTNGSSVVTVTLNGLNTTDTLGLIPGQQVTLAGMGVSALNGVYVIRTNNWTASGNTFEMEGPSDSTGTLINQTATQTYTMVDSGGNGTTSFDRYNIYTTVGARFVEHTSPYINHTRASIHDWKATTAKYWFRQQVSAITADRIFVKNHGLTTGEPILYIGGGNTWSGGVTAPADGTVYFANVINKDQFDVYTTENLTAGSTPYSTAVGATKVNFSTATTSVGGMYQFHPGFTINNFTTSAATGGAGTGRDRVIAQFNILPSYIQENTPIVLKAGSGSTVATGVVNTPDTYTSYQKYYVESIASANTGTAVKEFSITTAPGSAPINFTGNATQGTGKFYAFRIEENPYSNSIYLVNHGGTAVNQTVGGTGTQGTYPTGFDYPGPLFDLVSDGSGRNWPRVRMAYTAATPITGLTNGSIYYMVPVTNNIFKMQAYSVGVLPTGQPTVQLTAISGVTAIQSFANTAVGNPLGNRIIVPKQTQAFVENALVRYENQGGTDIGSPYTGAPGLINNNQYIVKNVATDVPLALPGTLYACSATETALQMTAITNLSTGDYIRVGNETMLVGTITGSSNPYTVNVTRAVNGGTAAAYEEGQVVEKLYGTFQLYTTTQVLPRTFSTGAGDTTLERWTFTNHGLRTAETVMVTATSGGGWAGTLNVLYYVIVVDANTFSLALSPALAYAAYPIDISTAGTAWTFRQFYNAIPLAGLASTTVNHSLEDTSSTGTLDGGYTVATVPTATSMTFTTSATVGTREFKFDPQDQLNLTDGIFYIPNHGFSTGTAVTYSKAALTYAIGDSATGAADSYNKLTSGTVYYAISKELNAFQLATTKANALAGVAITRLSNNGSAGSHVLTTAQVAGDSLGGGLATVIARDIVVNGSSGSAVLAASDRIVFSNHGFNTGDRVVYQVWAGGTQINGLLNGRQYFVSNAVFTGATAGGAASGQTANQFSLHNTWVGAYTNTDRADILGVGTGSVHQFKVTNPTLTGTTYKGEWNTSDNYYYGDVVLFRNSYYMAVAGTIAVPNTARQPISDAVRYDLNWQVCPSLPSYSTKFLTGYRGGDTIKLSNTIPRRTIYFDGSSATRVVVADNTINFTAAHGLRSGDAVIYRIDAIGGASQAASSDYDSYASGLPQTAIGGLVANRVYYVNVVDATYITLHTSPSDALRGGSGDTGNFQYAVNLTAVGTGVYHRFDVLEHAQYSMTVLAVNNDKEMVVTDPFPSRAISFNPQETTIAVSGLVTQNVNIATDEITLTAHGLQTGTKVYYSIGPANSGTVIGGLTDGGTYYIIRVNDNTVRLASTLNNALKAISIDLTSTGSGFAHYLVAATAAGSSWIRYNSTGDITSGTTFNGGVFFTGQNDGNIKDGVLTGLPIINETQMFVRPDCMNVHRPFDGGVEINASRAPNVSIVRQTRKYFRYQSGKGIQYSSGINFSPSIDVSRITHDGATYATVVTRRPHKLAVGNKVIVENVGSTSEYEATKCERDLGYLFRGAAYDVALGTNYNSIFLGIAEVNSLEITEGVKRNITNARNASVLITDVAASGTAVTRSNAFWNEVLDIINNGRASADALSYTNPTDATPTQIAAKVRLVNNRTFLATEVNAWVNATYPNHNHDEAKCIRDVKYAIDALTYDILYGGNSATYDQAKFFFYGFANEGATISPDHRLQTVAAYGRLKAIMSDIMLGNLITKSAGNALTQDTTGSNADSNEITTLENLIQVTANVVAATTAAAATAALPATRTAPSISWATAPIQAASTAITAESSTIIANIVRGAPYTTPASGPFFQVATVVDDYTFKYVTNGLPYDLAPRGFPNLFVYEWSDAVVRAGMFDDQNGMFWEYDGKSLHAVRRNSTKQLGGYLTVTNKSNTVAGINTNFTKQLEVDNKIVIRGMSYRVTKVVSDTSIQVSPAYRGTSRTNVIATLTQDLRVPQKDWSLDKCDGSGRSGFILDINRMQMAYMDYAWYGAGKVRFGFKGRDGHVMYVHEFIHNNRETEAYLRSGNLPARYEIKNGNAPTYAPSLYHWGASVIMDGGFEDDKAYLFTVASGSGGSDTISIPQALAGTNVPILSMRLAPSVDNSLVGPLGERDIINRMSIALQSVGLVVGNTNNKPASVKLILNGALSQQAYFANYGAPSLTQVIKHTGTASDSVFGGVTIYEFRAAVNSPVTAELNEIAELGNSILGGDYVYPNGPDVITVCVVPTDTGAATTVTARISWKESQA